MTRASHTWDLDPEEIHALCDAMQPVLGQFGADAHSSNLLITRLPQSGGHYGMAVRAYEILPGTPRALAASPEPLAKSEHELLAELIVAIQHLAPGLRALEIVKPSVMLSRLVAVADRAEAAINAKTGGSEG